MFEIDAPTAMRMVGLLYLVLPVNTWIVLARYRTPAMAWWCAGSLLTGIGVALIGFREVLPHVLGDHVPNTLLVMSYWMLIQSFCLDLGQRLPMRWLAFAGLGALLFLSVLDTLENHRLSLVGTRTVLFVLVVALAVLALRLSRKERSTNARLIGMAYVLLAAIFLFNLAFAASGLSGDRVRLDSQDWALFALFGALASSVGQFCYLGMVLERSLRQQSETAALRARTQENQRLGQKLAQMDRQHSLGVLSVSLGHELNQPLSAILIYTQLAQRVLSEGHAQALHLNEWLNKVVFNTKRASRIIERIRGFIRPAPLRIGQVDLAPLVANVWVLLRQRAAMHEVQIVPPPQASSCLLMADSVQLSQVVLNVLRNAIEATQASEVREIHVTWTRQGDNAVLRVRDTGPGMTQHVLEKAGTPFFTTKEGALGLGLSIARNILAQFGGTLALSNAEEGGALVEITLPVAPQSQEGEVIP